MEDWDSTEVIKSAGLSPQKQIASIAPLSVSSTATHPMACKVTIEPAALHFDSAASQTVLQAAEAAGIELPSSCRNGTCRTCLCRLRSGSVTYAIEWPGVSAEEIADGYFLPCVASAASDLVVEQAQARSIFTDANGGS
jgi:ferredoxin